MYEREVELAMRDSEQLISRGDAERGAGAVARWFRLGWRIWLSSCNPDLLPLAGDPRAFKAKAEETFAEIIAQVFAKAREAKIEVPALEDTLLKAINAGAPYKIACLACGISEDAFVDWRRKDQEFARRVEEASGKVALRLLGKIEKQADENFFSSGMVTGKKIR
jgi:hypothetical protein